jgi:hypothetical protein
LTFIYKKKMKKVDYKQMSHLVELLIAGDGCTGEESDFIALIHANLAVTS